MSDTLSMPWSPPDTHEAYAEWGANCGPAALAALSGLLVNATRRWFPSYPGRAWTNPSQMRAAIDAAGLRYEVPKLGPKEFPAYGFCFIQWEGPWLSPGVPIGAAYRNTHWVATCLAGQRVYDVNAGEWIGRDEWEEDVVPHIVAHTPRATGGWFVRTHLLVHGGV
jgi:hypothetical protein